MEVEQAFIDRAQLLHVQRGIVDPPAHALAASPAALALAEGGEIEDGPQQQIVADGGLLQVMTSADAK